MDVVVTPHALAGTIEAIASKSVAHRMLICAALSGGTTDINCPTTSVDIDATAACIRAIGASVSRTKLGFRVVSPISKDAPENASSNATLDVGESGSTLRFLLPVVCALGCNASLVGHGRLASRPLSPLYEELIAGGADLSEQGVFPLHAAGHLRAGRFELPGNISSQYVSGLLMAAPMMQGTTSIRVADPVESRPYIDLTIDAMREFAVDVEETHEKDEDGSTYTVFSVDSSERYRTPGIASVEGDWSNSAFWLAAGAIGKESISVSGLNLRSAQGDRSILAALSLFGAKVSRSADTATVHTDTLHAAEIDVRDFPDLVPPLAAVACLAQGTTRLTHAERLRLKESDRLESVSACISSLGGKSYVDGDDLVVEGTSSLAGGIVDAHNDHRIAMQAAILASRCTSPITILGAQCTSKSYPTFFDDYAKLGGVVCEKE